MVDWNNVLLFHNANLRNQGLLRYYRNIQEIEQLTPQERDALASVAERFAFRVNAYYLSLIDWNDPKDPIRRLIIPDVGELQGWGRLDPSGEASYTVVPGLEHKYASTALLLT